MKMNYGSLINVLADNAPVKTTPKVGDGAIVCMWSDRKAATVISVRTTASGKLVVTTQDDIATRVDGNGMSDAQMYEYTRNPNGVCRVYTERKDGVLREKSGMGTTLSVGHRNAYYDYSF